MQTIWSSLLRSGVGIAIFAAVTAGLVCFSENAIATPSDTVPKVQNKPVRFSKKTKAHRYDLKDLFKTKRFAT